MYLPEDSVGRGGERYIVHRAQKSYLIALLSLLAGFPAAPTQVQGIFMRSFCGVLVGGWMVMEGGTGVALISPSNQG